MARPGERIWTEEENEYLLYLRDVERRSWPAISRIMLIDQKKCMSKYSNKLRTTRPPIVRRLNDEILAERQRRHDAIERQSLSGLICGDPPPGFSALDKRRASA